MPAVEPVLLTITQITTRRQHQTLTKATGFFFRREQRLFLITNRHVVIDEASGHHPDEILIRLFNAADNLTQSADFSIPLFNGPLSKTQPNSPLASWIEASDSSGTTDVVAIELQQDALPKSVVYEAFSPATLCAPEAVVEVGSLLMVPGFPLGFEDSLHHLPVVRQATLASSFGLRFQGMGYFLTDAVTHRGISGAPVIRRVASGPPAQPAFHWELLGIHAARLDVARDLQLDSALGLNCAWYADILLTLTD